MSNKCSAFMCNKTLIHGVELFKFPINCSHNWIFAVDRGPTWKPKTTSRLCSDHFPQDAFIVTDNKTILKEGSQPLPGKATSISEEDKIVMKLISANLRQEELKIRNKEYLKNENTEVWSVIEILKKMEEELIGFSKLVARRFEFDPLCDEQVLAEKFINDVRTVQRKLENFILFGNQIKKETESDLNNSNLESEADVGPIKVIREGLGTSKTTNIMDLDISIIHDDTLLESINEEDIVDINNETIKFDIDEIYHKPSSKRLINQNDIGDDQDNIGNDKDNIRNDQDNIDDYQEDNIVCHQDTITDSKDIIGDNKENIANESKSNFESTFKEISNNTGEVLVKYKTIKPKGPNESDNNGITSNFCELCEKVFANKYNLETHNQNFHKKKRFSCDDCGKGFHVKNKLTAHQRKIHKGLKPYACDICEKAYTKNCSLQEHKKIIHEGEKPPKGVKHYACDICGKKFSKKSLMTKHLATRNSNHSRYNCPYCEQGFSEIKPYILHKRNHRFECDVCGKSICNLSAFRNHQKLHGDRTYSCKDCDMTFTDWDELTVHKRKHRIDPNRKNTDKRFPCDVCGKDYASLYILNNHKLFHTGERTSEKSYVCDICGKSFVRNLSLERHKVVHTGEFPYECKICGKKYVMKDSYTRHKDNHRPKIPCTACGKEYSRMEYYLKHLRNNRCKPVE